MMRIYWNCTQWIEMHSQSQAELVDPKFREKAMLHAADILWVLFCGSQRYHIFIPGRISYVCRFLSMDLKLCLFAHLHFRKIFVQRMVTYGNISQNGESAGHVPWWFWWSFTMNTWQVTLAMGPASGTCVCGGNAFILRLGRLWALGICRLDGGMTRYLDMFQQSLSKLMCLQFPWIRIGMYLP